jgi:flagellar basal-body rod protein FlgF
MKNIWVPLSGQIAQQRKVETIANNVANANTAGFKKDQLVFKEHLTALSKGSDDIHIPRKEFSPDDFYHTQGAENAYVDVAGSYTNHDQGQLVPTNNPFDVALNGKGFIEVLTPQGVRYTRTGNLSLSKDGELVTSQGFKVLQPLTAKPEELRGPAAEALPSPEERILKLPHNQAITISREGGVLTRQGLVGSISVVEFEDVHALRKEGNNLFINPSEANAKRVELATTVNQGFIEGSNVNAVEEMSELIKAHRHFESIQKAINAYDSVTGKAVNDINKF